MTLNLSTITESPSIGVPRPFLTPLPEPGEFLFVVDNSSAERFVCPTLAKNYIIDRREPQAKNAALVFGGALHVGLERLERGESVERQDEGVRDYFVSHPPPTDEYRTVGNCLQVLAEYRIRRKFPDYDATVLSDEKGLLIERAFELPLGVLELDTDIPGFGHVHRVHVAWSGRMDAVINTFNTNRIMDNKTTSRAGDEFTQDFQLSSQTLGYAWAGQQLWPQHFPHGEAVGFCVNAIVFKKPTGSGGLTERGPRGGEPPLSFFRSYYDYSPQRVARWAEDQIIRIEDFFHCVVRDHFPMERTYCFNRKYGRCPYHDVCTLDDPKVAKAFLHGPAFSPVTWNPTHDR